MDRLDEKVAQKFMSGTGIAIYLSLDRYDIQYIMRALAGALTVPMKLDMHRLKHLVKYLKGTADWAWMSLFQDIPRYLVA